VPPFGGVFYDEPTEAHLAGALERFEKLEPEVRAADLQEHARRFSAGEFSRKMRAVLENCGR
jgi:hypothetical protein